VLAHHPAVGEAAVVARTDGGESRLVAYVLAQKDTETRAVNGEDAAATWAAVWDATYRETEEAAGIDATFNIVGWNSSYTEKAMSGEEMRAWVDETASRIAALGPRRALEIGCGTGLLLFRIAPRCTRYVGVDFSESALRQIDAKLESAGLRSIVALRA